MTSKIADKIVKTFQSPPEFRPVGRVLLHICEHSAVLGTLVEEGLTIVEARLSADMRLNGPSSTFEGLSKTYNLYPHPQQNFILSEADTISDNAKKQTARRFYEIESDYTAAFKQLAL